MQFVLDAMSLGSLYALYSLGIALIFGVGRVVNFAHGELLMVGVYAIAMLSFLPWPVAVGVALISCILLALAMEFTIFRRFRRADATTVLIAGFALSVLLQNLAIMLVGQRQRSVALGSSLMTPILIGDLSLPKLQLVALFVTAGLCAFLIVVLRFTTLGLQVRAAAADLPMARLLGIRANIISMTAFGFSGLLAGAAAVLLGIQTGSATPQMGTYPILIAFVATIVGGMGSLLGSAVGGFLIGGLTVLLQVALPEWMASYRDSFVFGLVVLVLLVRPEGLLSGAYKGERV